MKTLRRDFLHSLSLGMIGLILIAHSVQADVTYVMDDLGRLEAVIDPATETALFSYDSVGNLLGITRRSSAILSVIDFAPKCGVTNDVITLSGTAFSLVANQNLVQFNGTPATVSSASATQLVVSLPAGVTSGTVSVTSPTGTTTSSQVFLPGVCGAS